MIKTLSTWKKLYSRYNNIQLYSKTEIISSIDLVYSFQNYLRCAILYHILISTAHRPLVNFFSIIPTDGFLQNSHPLLIY
ncbi:hypothetical protein SAMN05880574_1115 [Chryseobacterium sp. RU37D]|nr:hypothetical protein SAMN05880574_1115 [Chryseobacterium sp. RU37D]